MPEANTRVDVVLALSSGFESPAAPPNSSRNWLGCEPASAGGDNRSNQSNAATSWSPVALK
ncbi:MAG TPA: hypothetical protein PKY01_15255 [Candidatus Hydrogenedentes bacterium]|nr:hypothetical protein [Candidatus Hydrogenedentota bacterium]